MIPILSRRISLIRTCIICVLGAGIAAPTALAQLNSGAERQYAAGGQLTPLKLPPLPPKKIPAKNFGDWAQRCDPRPGVSEQKCYLTQTVVHTKDQKKQGLLAITVGFFGPDKKPGMILRVPLGFGVFLPPGFRFTVPGVEPIRMVIQSCLPTGCTAKTPLTPDVLAAMKNSDTGSLELYTIRKQLIRVPISFKGFTAALTSMHKG